MRYGEAEFLLKKTKQNSHEERKVACDMKTNQNPPLFHVTTKTNEEIRELTDALLRMGRLLRSLFRSGSAIAAINTLFYHFRIDHYCTYMHALRN